MTTNLGLSGNNSYINNSSLIKSNNKTRSNNNQSSSPPPPQSSSLYSTTATTTTNATTAAAANNNTNAANNRLQFNRLATERKTVHGMTPFANKNEPAKQRDRQMLTTFNNATGGAAIGNVNSAGVGGSGVGGVGSYNANAGVGGANQSSLDYNMTTGRNNAGSFLQKLSSKFSRR